MEKFNKKIHKLSSKMRLVFMGTSFFSLKSLSLLKKIQDNDRMCSFEIIAVYTQAPKASGRNYKINKSPVHEFAEKNNIPVFTPTSLRNEEQIKIFKSLNPDVCVVSSYGIIVPANILDIPIFGFINIHASLLPRWRGAAPIQAAILAGDVQTGITIMKMDAGIDTGDIISMKYINITSKTNHGDLEEELGNLGAGMIVDTINDLEYSLENAYKQPEIGADYATKISKEMCKIDWSNSSENILRQIMAFSPVPGAWTEIEGVRLKILDADVCDSITQNEIPGKIFDTNNGIAISCKKGFLIITKVHPAGRKIMNAEDFFNGHRDLIGKKFDAKL